MAWRTGGMTLPGEIRSTRNETCLYYTLFTLNPTWTELGLHLGLCSERLAANCPRHSTTIF